MRALRTCDFCGAEAAGTFAILPDELDPTETEQRRVVLCSGCKERLETLVEPLLARAGADADAGGGNEADAGGDRAVGVRGNTGEDGTVNGGAEASGGPGDRGPDASDGRTPARVTDASSASGAGSPESGRTEEAKRPGSDSNSSDGVVPERDPDEAGRGSEVGAAVETGRTDERGEPDRTEGPAADEPAADELAASPPPNYPNVLRLLRNREFPMERAAVESLAAGAYDLEGPEVEAIVDHAIANGELVADGDQLRRP